MNITNEELQTDLRKRFQEAREEEKRRKEREQERLKKTQSENKKAADEIMKAYLKEIDNRGKWLTFGAGTYWKSHARMYKNEKDKTTFIEILDEDKKTSRFNYIFRENAKVSKTIRPIEETINSYRNKANTKVILINEAVIKEFFPERTVFIDTIFIQADRRPLYY